MTSTINNTVPEPMVNTSASSGSFEPLRLSRTAETDPRYTKREPLFFLGSTACTIPLAFPASVLLEYIHRSTRFGIDAAIDYAFETALGVEDYALLRSHRQLTDDQYVWIRNQILARLFGREQAPKAETT